MTASETAVREPLKNLLVPTDFSKGAERVIRTGDVPVLVATRNPPQRYRRPLVATDLEDATRRTFELAPRVLGAQAKTVDLVHAFTRLPLRRVGGPAHPHLVRTPVTVEVPHQ